jgi:succinoglycan biosynthesis transport protein ExoP
MLEMVALQPYSRFSETLRNVRASIESTRLKRPVQVVCIASSVPKEGKSVVSANLARLACMSGVRVLLVDCDLHGRSLTKQLAPGAVTGLLQALQNSDGLSEHIVRLANCDLDFLPATFDVSRRDGSTRLSSSQMSELLPRLRSRYDYIVLDLAPVLPVTDAKAISHLVDSFVYVIKWGDTPRSIVAEAISSAGEPFREKLLGVVLNRASEKELGRYEPYKAKILQTYYMEPT